MHLRRKPMNRDEYLLDVSVPLGLELFCPVPRVPPPNSEREWNLGPVDYWWKKSFSVLDHPKVRMCLAHFVGGRDWSETGIVDWHVEHVRVYGPSVHGSSRSDFAKRYERLDALFDFVKRHGEFPRETPRGRNGVMFHIAPPSRAFRSSMHSALRKRYGLAPGNLTNKNWGWWSAGVPMFAGSGCHRLSIAIAVGLPSVQGTAAFGASLAKQDRLEFEYDPNA